MPSCRYGHALSVPELLGDCVCRGSLLPDPRHDAVRVIVLAVADDDEEVPDGERGRGAAARSGQQDLG